MNARRTMAAVMAVLVLTITSAARADAPSQEDVFRSISHSVNDQGSVSGKTMAGIGVVVVAVVLVAVVLNNRQSKRADAGWRPTATSPAARRATGGPANQPGKLVRELMRETGLTKAQVRQLEAANDRLAADDKGVEHLATLLLCPSLLTAARDRA